jgi:hypothetical protein
MTGALVRHKRMKNGPGNRRGPAKACGALDPRRERRDGRRDRRDENRFG